MGTDTPGQGGVTPPPQDVSPTEMAIRLFTPASGTLLSMDEIDQRLNTLPGLEHTERHCLSAYAQFEHLKAHPGLYRSAFFQQQEPRINLAVTAYEARLKKIMLGWLSPVAWVERWHGTPRAEIEAAIRQSAQRFRRQEQLREHMKFFHADPLSPHFAHKGYEERAAALTSPLAKAVFAQLSRTEWSRTPLHQTLAQKVQMP